MQFIPSEYRGGDDALKAQALQQGLTYLSAIITGLVLCSLVNAGSKGAGLTFTARSLAWGAAGIICAWPVVQAAGIGFVALHEYRTGSEVAQQVSHPTLKLLLDNQNSPWAWSIAALAIIGAPVVEEIIYRGFMSFYGLIFPAYVWICMLPLGTTRTARRVWTFAAAVVLASPFYWMGFIERETIWLVPGVAVVLFAKLIAGGAPRRIG
jgi:membrane protease YdiL (CAAX protease family)